MKRALVALTTIKSIVGFILMAICSGAMAGFSGPVNLASAHKPDLCTYGDPPDIYAPHKKYISIQDFGGIDVSQILTQACDLLEFNESDNYKYLDVDGCNPVLNNPFAIGSGMMSFGAAGVSRVFRRSDNLLLSSNTGMTGSASCGCSDASPSSYNSDNVGIANDGNCYCGSGKVWDASIRMCVGSTEPIDPPKSLGPPPCPDLSVENPCNASTGNKYQREDDAVSGFGLTRHYNSKFNGNVGLGVGWTSNLHVRLEIANANSLLLREADGRGVKFTKNASGQWTADADITLSLTQDASGFDLSDEIGKTWRFSTTGRLANEKDVEGRTTTYTYNGTGQLTTVADPFGQTLTLAYTPSGLIQSVTHSSGGTTQYSYTNVDAANAYRAEIISESPQGYWRLKDTGTSAANEMNASASGTYGGVTTPNQPGPGPGSKSVAFNPAGHGEVTLSDVPIGAGAFTLELWVNPDPAQSGGVFLFNRVSYYGTSYSDFPMSLNYYPPDGFTLRLATSNDWQLDAILSSGPVTPGQWYHVVAVYRPHGWCEVWVNGVLKKSQVINFGVSVNYRPWKLAKPFETGPGVGQTALHGKLSEAAVYTRALTADRIGAHYTAMTEGRPSLTRVDYADGSAKIYHYENTSLPYNLTGISLVETTGVTSRYATYGYDNAGNATLTEHAGGVNNATLVYDAPNQTTVTYANGVQRVFSFKTQLGVKQVISIVNKTDGKRIENKFDTRNNIVCRKEEDGRVTTSTYNATNQLTSMTEGLNGTCFAPVTTAATRTTTYSYSSPYRKAPSSITSPSVAAGQSQVTSFTYGGASQVLPTTVTRSGFTPNGTAVSRSINLSYLFTGSIQSINGPRTDVTDVSTFTYHACFGSVFDCGQVHVATNALGQTTTYHAYAGKGRPLSMTDPNGVLTTFTYDTRQRLASRTVGTETTSFEYTAKGNLKKVTLPDGSFIAYSYDAAQRLIGMQDGEGNSIVYTLDAMGNRTHEELFDPSNALTQTSSRVFNVRNQVAKEIGAAGTPAVTTNISYDTSGNPLSINAPLNRTTVNQYDALSRLSSSTDPLNGVTQFGYNALDQLTSVTDPRNAVTGYSYNDFGDLLVQQSPDTGTTQFTYDSGGNIATRTDARGRITSYSYDALNRITLATTSDENIQYQYDQGLYGIGRLTSVTGNSGQTSFAYTAHGRIASRTQTIGGIQKTVAYTYNAAGQLATLTLPSGQALHYTYAHGKVASVSLASGTTIANNILYEPFGPIRGWSFGNGTLATRVFDADGKLTHIDSAGAKTLGYDDAFRITQLTDVTDPNKSQTLGYDSLDRLVTASGTGLNQSFIYDANGNRLSQGGSQTTTFVTSATSNRLDSVSGALNRTYSLDAAGNTLNDGTRGFTYNDAGRMTTAASSGVITSYSYNAFGQRVRKSNTIGTTYFVYDDAGHLLGEYDAGGALIQELVWLGDIPIASIRTDQTGGSVGVFYIHTDHLNTPRKITRPSDNAIVWRWDSDPFGNGAPNPDPDNNGLLLAFNLRFPGQYFDGETGNHYNYFRDYDPSTGRYVESDPIGLGGGINTFGYVGANPSGAVDIFGLVTVIGGDEARRANVLAAVANLRNRLESSLKCCTHKNMDQLLSRFDAWTITLSNSQMPRGSGGRIQAETNGRRNATTIYSGGGSSISMLAHEYAHTTSENVGLRESYPGDFAKPWSERRLERHANQLEERLTQGLGICDLVSGNPLPPDPYAPAPERNRPWWWYFSPFH